MRHLVLLPVALLAAGLSVSACTSAATSDAPASAPAVSSPATASAGSSSTASPAASPQSPTSSTTAALMTPAPALGECWTYPLPDFWTIEENPAAKKVDCAERHTAVTVYVGELDSTLTENPFAVMTSIKAKYTAPDGTVDLTKATPEDTAANKAAFATLESAFADCREALGKEIGATLPNGFVQASIFGTDITGPTAADWDNGARWVRCNATAQVPKSAGKKETSMTALPTSIKGVMQGKDSQRFRECFRTDAKARATYANCTSKAAENMWMTATTALPMRQGMPWVSRKRAIDTAINACRVAVEPIRNARFWSQDNNISVYASSTAADGTVTFGLNKDMWGKPGSNFICRIANAEFLPTFRYSQTQT